jgi:hypothetical protein
MKKKAFYKSVSRVLIALFLLSTFYFLFSKVVFAADSSEVSITCAKFKYPWCGKETGTPAGLVARFYQVALGLVGGAALGVILYGAILWTLSEAVTKKQEALDWIKGAVWGLVLLLGAYLILWTINPDLVNLRNPALEPIPLAPEKPLSSTIEGITQLADDSKTRTYFLDDSDPTRPRIGINKNQCRYEGQQNCTSLANLPQSAVDGIIKMAQECQAKYGRQNCYIFEITGGTEAGHKEHGPGKAVIDLRLQSSGSAGYDRTLYSYFQDKIGLQSSFLNPEKIEYNKRYEAKDGSFTVIRETNGLSGLERTEHFHIVFK